jgi:hypothetical protein
VLTVAFSLGVAAIFFSGAGPVSRMLGVVAFIAFGALILWAQISLARARKEVADWGGGPMLSTLHSTLAALRQRRKSKRSEC